MKRLVLYLCISSNLLYAQGEWDNWCFGNKVGLDFNYTPPVELIGSQMDAGEGCASVSDSEGNLLFYTNGAKNGG